MFDIEDVRKKRFQFLHRLWEITGGNQKKDESMWNLGRELGFIGEETSTITQYLKGEGLIKYVALGGLITITHEGVVEVEKALSEPEQLTEHFSPVVNVVNVQHMEGSQIQQGTVSSSQTGRFSIETKKSLSEFISLLKDKLSELKLQGEDKAELDADIATVEAQLSSGRPKSSIVKESINSIKRVLEGATGGVIAGELLKYIPAILAAL